MFDHCTTPQEVKKLFSTLAHAHHPDHAGGDNETMRLILEAYHKRLEELDGYTASDEKGQPHTYTYNRAREDAQTFAAYSAAIISPELIVEMVGTWVWVTGNTRAHKDEIKALSAGFEWQGKRKAWYWKPYTRRRTRYAEDKTLDEIKNMYGAERMQPQAEARPASIGG